MPYPHLFKALVESALVTCQKCGYTWLPRKPDPKECPECKSRRYAQPRGEIELLTEEDFHGAVWDPVYVAQYHEDERDEVRIDARIGTAIRAFVFHGGVKYTLAHPLNPFRKRKNNLAGWV